MKRVFFFGVIAYSVVILLLNDMPAAVNLTGVAAAPWMAKCLVDLCFAGAAFFVMFGSQIDWDDEDEEAIHADDVKVPSTWLYGLFGLNLLANFGWHAYEAAVLSGGASFYNLLWFFVEFVAMGLTFVFFSHARKIAKREQRRARDAARTSGSTSFDRRDGGSGSDRPRSVA
jgi:hypothetical protein